MAKVKVKFQAPSGEALGSGIQRGEEKGTPGTASVSVRGERVPLTPEGLAKARCGAAKVGRELADNFRRRLDID
jgi:hypothetical protein